jgi:sugar O-acyltransferase (sialic acid O-acetyltransferase NeuD family)
MVKRVVIWGASGHAKVLAEFLAAGGRELVALVDNDPACVSPFPHLPLLLGEDGVRAWRRTNADEHEVLVAIGGQRGQDRLDIQRFMVAQGFSAATVVHPTAFVAANASLGAGSQVLAQAAVCVDVRLGAACIVNTAASVDHESVLGDGVHLAPGATIAGCVRIGDHTLIGTGSVVLPRIAIGRGCLVGAGSVVTRDLPDGVVAYGNPARIIRAHRP